MKKTWWMQSPWSTSSSLKAFKTVTQLRMSATSSFAKWQKVSKRHLPKSKSFLRSWLKTWRKTTLSMNWDFTRWIWKQRQKEKLTKVWTRAEVRTKSFRRSLKHSISSLNMKRREKKGWAITGTQRIPAEKGNKILRIRLLLSSRHFWRSKKKKWKGKRWKRTRMWFWLRKKSIDLMICLFYQ